MAKHLQRLADHEINPLHAAALKSHADGLTKLAKDMTPNVSNMLTPMQGRVLSFIRQHIASHEQAPTRKEISESFGFASANAAQDHIRALERKGHITLTGAARGIRVNKRTAL